MENASKALIIAGSILVSIVIITLGVMIVNNVTGLVRTSSDMSEQEVATFNSKFENYEGLRVSGSNVRALYNAIKSNNNQHQDDPTLQVNFVFGENATPQNGDYENSSETPVEITTKISEILVGRNYEVKFTRDQASNRIVACYVKPSTGNNTLPLA